MHGGKPLVTSFISGWEAVHVHQPGGLNGSYPISFVDLHHYLFLKIIRQPQDIFAKDLLLDFLCYGLLCNILFV